MQMQKRIFEGGRELFITIPTLYYNNGLGHRCFWHRIWLCRLVSSPYTVVLLCIIIEGSKSSSLSLF